MSFFYDFLDKDNLRGENLVEQKRTLTTIKEKKHLQSKMVPKKINF